MNGKQFYLWEMACKIAVRLPGAFEKLAYGTPAVYVDKKMFARIREDGETLVVYNNDRDEWIASNPDTFFFTDHYKDHPLVLVDLKTVEIKDLEELLIISWKIRASKMRLKEFNR